MNKFNFLISFQGLNAKPDIQLLNELYTTRWFYFCTRSQLGLWPTIKNSTPEQATDLSSERSIRL